MLLAIIAIAIDALAALPGKWHPITIVQLLAKKMADKVQPPIPASSQQHIISGSLAYIILFGPFIVIFAFLLEFAAYRAFFESLLLIACLSFSQQVREYKRITLALGKQQKSLAREWLRYLVKRDTQPLSDIGIGKAAMESLLLRFCYQYITVLVVFFAGGAIAAFAYRIALECRWQWKRSQVEKDIFVLPVTFFCRLCQWPAVFISCILLNMLIWPRNTRSQNREKVEVSAIKWSFWQTAPVLQDSLGKKMGIGLSGPAKYNGHKKALPRLGAPYQVRLSDMPAVGSVINIMRFFIGSVLLIGVVSVFYLAA